MIIPIRCFTCGKILANRWNAYLRAMKDAKEENPELVTIIDEEFVEKFIRNPEEYKTFVPKKILDDLEISRVCCRKHFLCNVPMIDKI